MESIIESNKLIAEFMGLQKDNIGRFVEGKNILSLKYHSSWDWLMPVVEKISNHTFDDDDVKDTAYPRTFGMLSSNGKPMFRFNRFTLFERDTLIDAAYDAVVEFIIWHNIPTPNPSTAL